MHRFVTLSLMLALCAMSQRVSTDFIFDGTQDVKKWNNMRDQARISREFVKATHAMENGRLVWNFIPKPGTHFNDLFYMVPINRPCTKITVELYNYGEPFSICAKMSDAGHAEWSLKAQPLPTYVEGQPPQTLICAWDNWEHASWSSVKEGPMLFPISYFTIIAFGVQENKEYKIAIKSIKVEEASIGMELVNPPAVPREIAAGTAFSVPEIAVKMEQAILPAEADICLSKDGIAKARLPLAIPVDKAVDAFVFKADKPLELPWILRHGEYDMEVSLTGTLADGMPNVTAHASLGKVMVRRHNPYHPHTFAEVKPYNGTPTIFINGQPHCGMAYAAYGPNPKVYRDFTSVDVDLFTICATPTESGYNISPTAWKDPDTYDFSVLDTRVAMILNENPRAYIFPRLYVHAPRWWSEQHPDDVVIAEKPDGTRYVFKHTEGKPAPSWASKAWREDTIKGLRKLVEYVEDSPYANNFIGYHIASGTTEEWMMWGSNENEWVDYSPANLAYFREWLKNKYKTEAALKTAWNDRNVTFATAELPTYKQRAAAGIGSMRDPQKEMQVIDFYTYNSWLVADTITTLATAVKDACKRQKTVGVFYGYLLQLCGEQRQQNSGHNALKMVLDCKDIDFICSPTSYAFRQLGGKGTCHFMSLVDSVKLHGKLWFDENDVRTSLAPGKLGAWGKPANVDGDIIQQDKELACVLTNGVVQWWFDVGSNRYDDTKLLAAIKNYKRVAGVANTLDRTAVSEAAFLIDEDSLAYLKTGDHMGGELTVGRLPELHRGGMPVAHYLADDLEALKDFKLLFVANAFAPAEKLREKIDALKNRNRVIVFFNGAGAISQGTFAPEGVKSFTGINTRFDSTVAEGAYTFNGTPGFCDKLDGVTYGNKFYIQNPALIPDDPQATVVARYKDGRPAIAIRQYPDWTAVYCAQAQLPAQFYRNLAAMAGVHRYIETPDVVWANRSMLAVCVDKPGKRVITLPHTAKVTEMYSGKVISEKPVNIFTAEFPENATLLFRLD